MGPVKISVATHADWVYNVPVPNPNPKVPMAPKRKPTDIVNLKVRFTEEMRQRIEQEAKKNQRSLNGEIVYRLGLTFGAEGVALARQFEEQEKEVARALREIVERLIADKAPLKRRI